LRIQLRSEHANGITADIDRCVTGHASEVSYGCNVLLTFRYKPSRL
jgi:hypothetical protein